MNLPPAVRYVRLDSPCLKLSPDVAVRRLRIVWGYRGDHDEIVKHHIVATFREADIVTDLEMVMDKLRAINEQIEEHRIRMGVTVPDMQRIVDGEAFFIVDGGILTKGPADPIAGCGPFVVAFPDD